MWRRVSYWYNRPGGSVSTFTGTDDYIFGGEMIAGGPVREELRKAVEAIWYKQN